MRIATLNVAHQTRAPKSVPTDLLQALADMKLDALVLTEVVETLEFRQCIEQFWTYVESSLTVDHAFVSPEIEVVTAEYRPEFFGK